MAIDIGIGAIVNQIGDIAKRFIDDPEAQRKFDSEILGALSASDVAQNKVNEEEAKSDSLFIAGWRPAIGWVCSLGVTYHFILHPILAWYALNTAGVEAPPDLDWNELFVLVTGLLGMGTLRTVEKKFGVHR